MELLSVLKTSPLFAGVEEHEIEAMMGCLGGRSEPFAKGAYILTAGQTVEYLGLVVLGSAELVQEDYWGNRNLMGNVGAGQLFAEAFAGRADAPINVSVVAREKTTVLWLDIGRVMRTCSNACQHHSRIIDNLLSDLVLKNRALGEKVTHMARRTTRQKLLSYLSAQAERAGSGSFDIPFSRQELADYLAVDRSAMSTALGQLRDEGVLTFERNHFELLKKEEDHA